MLIDPAVNLVFSRMKSQLSDYKEKLEQAQTDLSAWKFTPDRLADSEGLVRQQQNNKHYINVKLRSWPIFCTCSPEPCMSNYSVPLWSGDFSSSLLSLCPTDYIIEGLF